MVLTLFTQSAVPVGRQRGHIAQRGTPRRRVTLFCTAASSALSELEENASGSSSEREQWAASVRGLAGRRKHRIWEPQLLDPPPVLADVSVVLVSPKRPNSVGACARALSSFECEGGLRIVAPRCNHLARAARNGSKGAQYLLWRVQTFDDLQAAIADGAVTVAFTRWVQGKNRAFRSPAELFAAPQLQHLFRGDIAAAGHGSGGGSSNSAGQPGGAGKVLLVFGREERGLTDEEVEACDYACSIPIGRLQESLSLSHAVSVVLSQLFQLRLANGGALPATAADLAPGYLHEESSDDE